MTPADLLADLKLRCYVAQAIIMHRTTPLLAHLLRRRHHRR